MFLASRVADALNVRENLDLYAIPGGVEPEDAVIVSRSNSKFRIPVQVVSTPGQPHIRSDYKIFDKLESALTSELQACGIDSGHFSVAWTETAMQHGLSRDLIAALAKVIAVRLVAGESRISLKCEDEYDQNPWMASVAHFVHGLRVPELSALTIASPTGCYLPRDGRWISDAIARKIKKYGPAGCDGIVLVIDGGNYVAREQVESFRTNFRTAECPFEHLWIVGSGFIERLK